MPAPAPHPASEVSQDPGAPRSSVAGGRFPVDPEATSAAGPRADAGADVWRALRGSFDELRENVGYLLAAKVDGLKILVRRIVLLAVLGIVGLIAAATVVVASVVMVLRGLARGLDVAMSSVWLGDLIVGAAILVVLTLSIWIAVRWLTGASRRATVRKYSSRKSQQRARFGRDVEGRSDAT